MARLTLTTLLGLTLLLATLVSAQQGNPPYSTNNAQSACVQFGSCSTAGGASVLTATQNSPVTRPAGTPALATYTTLDTSFISSLAAAGASSAYTGGGNRNGNSGGSSTRGSSGSSNTQGSSGSSSSGLGSLGGSGGSSGSNAGNKGVSAGAAVMQMGALMVAAVLGAAVLL